MASDLELSVFYALSCLQLEGLEVKDKQREAIQAVYYGKRRVLVSQLQSMKLTV